MRPCSCRPAVAALVVLALGACVAGGAGTGDTGYRTGPVPDALKQANNINSGRDN